MEEEGIFKNEIKIQTILDIADYLKFKNYKKQNIAMDEFLAIASIFL